LVEITQHLVLDDLIVPGEILGDLAREALREDATREPPLVIRDEEFSERVTSWINQCNLSLVHDYNPVVSVKTRDHFARFSGRNPAAPSEGWIDRP
jgi:hypothetical protein